MMDEGDEKGMMDRMMGGRVPGLAPERLPDPDSKGAGLMVRYCSQCHNLPSPATHSQEEWPKVVERMDHHMGMMKGMGHREMRRINRPTGEEKEIILRTLQAHGLKPFAAEAVPSPDSPGAKKFQAVCSRCHVLPDIRLHTKSEWPDGVDRMRMNMRVIGKPVITNPERGEIVAYLKEHSR